MSCDSVPKAVTTQPLLLSTCVLLTKQVDDAGDLNKPEAHIL